MHHYHFRVYALDVPSLKLSGNFDGPQVMKAMKSHILAKGESVAIYVLNPVMIKAAAK